MAHVISKEAYLTEYVSIGVKQHERPTSILYLEAAESNGSFCRTTDLVNISASPMGS